MVQYLKCEQASKRCGHNLSVAFIYPMLVSGAGGKEAALFTADVFYMYQKFAAFKQWMFETLEMATNESGGLKVGRAYMSSYLYSYLFPFV